MAAYPLFVPPLEFRLPPLPSPLIFCMGTFPLRSLPQEICPCRMGQDHGETVKCPQDQTVLEEDHLDHTSGSPLIVMALTPEAYAPVG